MSHDDVAFLDAGIRRPRTAHHTKAGARTQSSPSPRSAQSAARYRRTATPRRRFSEALFEVWGAPEEKRARVERLHRSIGVRHRHLALPIEGYRELASSFAKANEAWLRVGTELGGDAVLAALRTAGLGPRDVDHLFFTTVTGIAAPTIDVRSGEPSRHAAGHEAHAAVRAGVRWGRRRPGTRRRRPAAFPDEVAVLLSVELCSLTLQFDDCSTAGVIAAGLFGDGAAAVVLGGGTT